MVEMATILAIIRYVSRKKGNLMDRKESRRKKYQDFAVDIFKPLDGSEIKQKNLMNLPCHMANGDCPQYLRPRLTVQLEGKFHKLTKKQDVFIVSRFLRVPSASSVKELVPIQTLREQLATAGEAFALKDLSSDQLPAVLRKQSLGRIMQFFDILGYHDFDYDFAFKIDQYFQNRLAHRQYTDEKGLEHTYIDVADLLEKNPFLLLDLPDSPRQIKFADLRIAVKRAKLPSSIDLERFAYLSMLLNKFSRKGNAFLPMSIIWGCMKSSGLFNGPDSSIHDFIGKVCKNQDTSKEFSSVSRLSYSGKNNPYEHFLFSASKYYTEAAKASNVKNADTFGSKVGSGVYFQKVFFAEYYAAKMLADIASQVSINPELRLKINHLRGLDEDQKAAILAAFTHTLSVVTGSAGTGKSTVISKIIELLHAAGGEVMVFAPSALAASVTAAKILSPVSYQTLHRFSGLRPEDDDLGDEDANRFIKHDNLARDTFLIIDEMSMCTIPVLNKFLYTIKDNPQVHIVFFGDPAQLPAIGPQFFSQMADGLFGDTIPITRLRTNYRAANSGLAKFQDLVRQGKFIYDASCSFLEVHELTDKLALNIITDTARTLAAEGKDVLFLSASKSGKYSTRVLNTALRPYLSPFKNPLRLYDGSDFYYGDPVVTTQNDYAPKENEIFSTDERCADRNIDIFNGLMGHILEQTADDKERNIIRVSLKFPGNVKDIIVPYLSHEIPIYFEPAYAVTVHKAQGSERQVIVFVRDNKQQISRNMLYTAVTRAAEKVILFGSDWKEAVKYPVVPGFSKFAWRYLKAIRDKEFQSTHPITPVNPDYGDICLDGIE